MLCCVTAPDTKHLERLTTCRLQYIRVLPWEVSIARQPAALTFCGKLVFIRFSHRRGTNLHLLGRMNSRQNTREAGQGQRGTYDRTMGKTGWSHPLCPPIHTHSRSPYPSSYVGSSSASTANRGTAWMTLIIIARRKNR